MFTESVHVAYQFKGNEVCKQSVSLTLHTCFRSSGVQISIIFIHISMLTLKHI